MILRAIVSGFAVALLLAIGQGISFADQAQYLYDELGRLVGVIDGQNNAAVYTYDEVGNLLKIDRFVSNGGNVGIFLISPGSALAKNPDGTPANKPIEIRGFGFTTPPASNAVAFNGVPATVLSATASSLVAIVPSTATSGPVTVTNSNGTATSPQAFTVLVPPIITGVDPSRAPKGVVSRMTIQGFNLKTASAVQFSQAGLSVTIVGGATGDKLSINLTVGSAVPNGDYPFSVTTPSGIAQSGTIRVTVTSAFPGFNTTKLLTIQMPLNTSVPATMAPVGPTTNTSAVTSVQMPLNTTVPATTAPSGPSFDVSPVTSVGMP